jgi:hypothetical protein
MLTHYDFQIEHVDEMKTMTFFIQAKSLNEALKWAKLLNPSAILVIAPDYSGEIEIERV